MGIPLPIIDTGDADMANVFTKRHHKPRTTTLQDFSSDLRDATQPVRPRRPRMLSPTRRCNPHPKGLVFQSPYNRDNLTFSIWEPNFVKISHRMPEMLSHLERANFSSGSVIQPSQQRGALPDIKYSLDTTVRASYQKPEFPKGVPHEQKTTRFGYTPYKPARGIVPNTLPPITLERTVV